MKRTKLYILIFLLLSSILSAQKVDIYKRPLNFERSHDYDAVHYKLEFKFNLEKKIYWGENQVTLISLKDDFQQCVLDAEDFTVTSVAALNGEPLKFEQTDQSLIIDLSKKYDYKQELSFVIKYYEENSQKGLRFIEAAADYPAQINTFAWPEGARHWFPCFDFPNDKVTNELIATVQNDFKVLSNGKLVKVTEDKQNNTKTYHWSQELPHSTYLIMMAAGPFEVIEDSLGSLPVNYWVYKKDVPDAMRSFRKTPEMIDFYNKTFGFNYPWAKYAQVCIAGSGGGMEDTSATTLGHGTIHDERAEQDFSSDGLVAHELAHQWWGDTITERTWSHVWLSESFATYSEYLYSRHDRGEDEGAVNLLGKKNSYLREAQNEYIRPIVFDRYDNPWNIMDSHSYPKGATILNMLCFVMGEKAFFHSLQHFLEKHSFQAVDTHDLMIAVKESSGQNLDWFFEQWIFKPGHPVFNISYQWNESTRKLKLRIIQTQDTSSGVPIYKTPVIIGIVTLEERFSKKLWIRGKENEYVFGVKQKPLMVRFDEGNYLLKEWSFEKSLKELLFQLKNDDVIGRMWAASELKKFSDESKSITALIDRAENDSFWNVRKDAVELLGEIKRPEHIKLFKAKCEDKNSQVRAAALKVLGELNDPGLVSFFKDRFLKDDSYRAQAEAINAIGKCGSKADILFLKKAAQMESPRRIIKRAAERALKNIS